MPPLGQDINLNDYLIIYYSFSNDDNVNKKKYKYFTKKTDSESSELPSFIKQYKLMNNKDKVYNKNNINILLISIIFIWILILLIILKILSKILGENYGKVMLILSITLLLIGVFYSLFIVKK